MVPERGIWSQEGMVPGRGGMVSGYGIPYPSQTSIGGHQSGWYASYCNAFLLRLIALKLNLHMHNMI